MNEQDATQLIPWFLNGTLDEAERTAIESWIERSETVREELARWREGWATHAEMPSGEDLVGYVEGTLPPELHREIEAFALVSAPTREAIEMLREGRPNDAERQPSNTVVDFRARAVSGRSRVVDRWALPLAAALASAVLTSLLWWAGIAGPRQPEAVANVAVVELLPTDTRVRGEQVEAVDVGAEGRFLAVLVSDRFEPATDLRIRVVDADGTLRASLEGVARAADGTMTILLARPEGPTPHEIVVVDGAGAEVERFRLDLGSR